MIVTAQPFLNELDVLEIKFEELLGVADLHIVVESTKTFTGLDKRLRFLCESKRFEKYPVHHVIVDLPDCPSPWDREKLTHERIAVEVDKFNPDVVLYLDADEVPRRNAVERFLSMDCDTACLGMRQLGYFFNREIPWVKWNFAKIHRFKEGQKQPGRCDRGFPEIEEAGWHFQNMVGESKDNLMEKLRSFSHASDSISNGFSGRTEAGELVELDNMTLFHDLPEFVLQNPERFKPYFTL
jgi:beta-1,4-mannosyl-glycoprotein beta-1,4-N-acetylglucosaminyltransferase